MVAKKNATEEKKITLLDNRHVEKMANPDQTHLQIYTI
jgi:hypothetical protein